MKTRKDRIRKVFKLSPKITLCVEEVPSAYSTSVGLFCDVGSRHETAQYLGAAHVCEHMFFKRTSGKTAFDISKISERLGGELNAYTDRELTAFYGDSPTEQFSEMLGLIFEMLLDAQFSEDEFKGELDVVIQELLGFEDSPDDIFNELTVEVPWKKHPLSLRVGGTAKEVKPLTYAKIRSFIEKFYLQSNWVISVCSPLKTAEVKRQVLGELKRASRYENAWALSKVRKTPRPGGSAQLPKKLASRSAIHKYDTEQAQVCLTYPGMAITHPKEILHTGVASMLGQGSSSWLYREMREERGLVYHVAASDLSFSDCGAFQMNWSCSPGNMMDAFEVAAGIVNRLRNGLDPDEVKFVRESIQGATKMAFDGVHSRMEAMGRQQLLMNRIYGLNETLVELEKIQHKPMEKMARTLIAEPSFLLFGPVNKTDLTKAQKLWRKTLCLQ